MAKELVNTSLSNDKATETRQALRDALAAACDTVNGLQDMADAVLDTYGDSPENVAMTARMAASWLVQSGLDVVAAVRTPAVQHG